MRRLLIGAVLLPLLNLWAAVAEQPRKAEPTYDVKRCKPKVVSKKPILEPKAIQVRKGEKAARYPPVIAFEILESGEVVNARVKRSSGVADRDAYALNSIRGWRFNNRPGCGTVETEAAALIHFH
jgi:TonB family protein